MIVVIQCAAKKRSSAGFLKTKDGRPVHFVGDPAAAPGSGSMAYARPDDMSDFGVSWRDVLLDYNRNPGNNPLGLCRASDLYSNPIYRRIVDRIGEEKTYILSAGWGLINASFLTPNYDITFSVLDAANRYKRRRKIDVYLDERALPASSEEPVFFFGGKEYVPLFCKLTSEVGVKRTVFYNSEVEPVAPGCSIERFVTTTRTNWQNECASAFFDGKIRSVAAAS